MNTLSAELSCSLSTIASPQFHLMPISKDDDGEELILADGNMLPQSLSLHTSESEGPTDEYGGSEGDASEVVSGKESMDAVTDMHDNDTEADHDNEPSPNSDSLEYKCSVGSDSEASGPEDDPESMLPAIDLQKEFAKFMEMRKAAKVELKKGKGEKGKKKKTPAECKVSFLDVLYGLG